VFAWISPEGERLLYERGAGDVDVGGLRITSMTLSIIEAPSQALDDVLAFLRFLHAGTRSAASPLPSGAGDVDEDRPGRA